MAHALVTVQVKDLQSGQVWEIALDQTDGVGAGGVVSITQVNQKNETVNSSTKISNLGLKATVIAVSGP
jgi:hypothetical protein